MVAEDIQLCTSTCILKFRSLYFVNATELLYNYMTHRSHGYADLAYSSFSSFSDATVHPCSHYPARACASKGLCDRSWCLYIVYYILYIYKSALFLEPIFYLPKYSLSEVQFNTDRLLIEFNGLWYSLAARQVFVAITNPDNLSFG